MVGCGLGLGGRLQRHGHSGDHLQHDHRVQRRHQQVSTLQLQLRPRHPLTQVTSHVMEAFLLSVISKSESRKDPQKHKYLHMLQEHAPVRADRAAGGGVQADRQPPAAAEGAHPGHARQHHQVSSCTL